MTVPIAVTVSDTNYPLDGVYFPAISVCPVKKIITNKALEYIEKKLGPETASDPQISSFFKALLALRYPVYQHFGLHLENSKSILLKLEKINITELMIYALPECNEIFLECYWNGHLRNCCSLLSLQRSEGGFCYSFNSFTSEKNKNCIYRDAHIADNCSLLSTSNTGIRSGIAILLKPPHKATVQVHHPNEYPEEGMGSIVPVGNLDKLNIAVKPTITESSDEIRALPSYVSGCCFKDTTESIITRIYSQKSCLLECRMKFFQEQCGCLPYYITMMKRKTVPCNSIQLQCILDHIIFLKPPSDEFNVSENAEKKHIECKGCLPTCNERQYELTIDVTKDTTWRKRNYYAFIDVFYRTAGAIKYKREMTYDYVQLLVNLGGIGGLFLGGSILSILEAVYWLNKALLVYLWPVKGKVAQKKKERTNDISIISQHNWVN